MTENTLPTLDLEVLTRKIGALPASSKVILDLLRVIDANEISATALAEIVSRDQAIVVRLLRIANSSFYGLPGRVDSVIDAIAILGWRQVRNLATGIAIFQSFSQAGTPGFDFSRFGRHSVAVAVGARILASRMKLCEGGAFVAGLIHDVGRVAVAQAYPEHTAAIARHQECNACSLIESERAVQGIDHARIGGALAERWHFPSAICDAIAAHHAIDDDPDRPLDALTFAVGLANALDHCRSDHADPEIRQEYLSRLPWEKANLAADDGKKALAAIELELEFLCGMLMDHGQSGRSVNG